MQDAPTRFAPSAHRKDATVIALKTRFMTSTPRPDSSRVERPEYTSVHRTLARQRGQHASRDGALHVLVLALAQESRFQRAIGVEQEQRRAPHRLPDVFAVLAALIVPDEKIQDRGSA